MKAYIIICEHIKTRYRTVSQEAYKSLEQAQAFCLKRSGNIRKINEFMFVDEKHEYGYEITDVSVV